jgi:cobalamin biosynthesis Mg chelatase CobN
VIRRRQLLGSLAVIAALAMLVPSVALAGGGGSAGDQQYVDPLAGSSPSGSKSHSGSSSTTHSTAPSTSSSTSPASTPPPSSSTGSTAVSSDATATSSASAKADPPSTTLPRTGMDVTLAVAIALGMLGAGVALRRTVRQP